MLTLIIAGLVVAALLWLWPWLNEINPEGYHSFAADVIKWRGREVGGRRVYRDEVIEIVLDPRVDNSRDVQVSDRVELKSNGHTVLESAYYLHSDTDCSDGTYIRGRVGPYVHKRRKGPWMRHLQRLHQRIQREEELKSRRKAREAERQRRRDLDL